jgi:hypothetical protein
MARIVISILFSSEDGRRYPVIELTASGDAGIFGPTTTALHMKDERS